MEKNETLIVGERSVLPFSRGILAQSLIVSGLEPQEAYRVAEEVQGLLERGRRYKERELAQIVARHLRRTRGADIARRYKRSLDRRLTPMVHKGSAAAPFSKMVLARSLRAAGVDAASAFSLAAEIEDHIRRTPTRTISAGRLRTLTSSLLKKRFGQPYAERYLLWRRIKKRKKPVVILIGGATGVGKSTLSAELASLLEIPYVTSTDIIREMLRTMFSPSLLPHIHTPSYEAGKVLRHTVGDPFIEGFLQQAAVVCVGVGAIVRRAVEENTSIIINGVHIVPGLVDVEDEGALVARFVLVLDDEREHKGRFLARQRHTSRTAERYLKNFSAIRRIQDLIVKRAAERDFPIIESRYFDETVDAALNYVTETITKVLLEDERCEERSS